MTTRLLSIHIIPVLFCLLAVSLSSTAQVTVKGTVYNMTKTAPIEGVSVMSTSGKGTSTSNTGTYSLVVSEKDSIYFSYLNKSTVKFPVATIASLTGFDISINTPTNVLAPVQVMPPSYKRDSAQNRQDYAKVFDFKKPGLGITSAPTNGAGVGLDLDELINVFRFRRNKSMLAFQKRLVQEEEDKYVDHRFSKATVRKVTQLTGKELEYFMNMYRPAYEFTVISSDYEFLEYIKQSFLRYKGLYPRKQ